MFDNSNDDLFMFMVESRRKMAMITAAMKGRDKTDVKPDPELKARLLTGNAKNLRDATIKQMDNAIFAGGR